MIRHRIAFLAALAALLAFAVPAFGKSNAAAKSSIWVDMSWSRLSSADGALNYKDEMKFGYQTSVQYPTIQLQCFQNRVLVFAASHAAYPGGYGYDDPFQLGPSYAWSGGAAKCVGTLGHRSSTGRYVQDATTTFDVAA